MTTPDHLNMARDALKPCPHCGLTHTLKPTTAQELAEEGEDDPEPWMHSDSWAVICDMSRPNGPGGCGASGGFYPSEAEAIEAWNRRAAIDAMPASAPSGEPADPMDWPLPCDVKVGHGTHGKGTPLRSLVRRMQLLYDMAKEATAAGVKMADAAPAAPAPADMTTTKGQ